MTLLLAALLATSPQTTELLFQVGAGKHVVGAPSGSQYPPEAAKLPTIGTLFAPSLEKVLALRPTAVVLDALNANPSFEASVLALGLKTFVWDTRSPFAMLADARRLQRELGLSLDLKTVDKWENCLKRLHTNRPAAALKYVGLVWMDPPIAWGGGAFLSHLFSEMGYENALSSQFHSPYVPVTEEWLLQQKVDRAFYLQHASENAQSNQARLRRWWPDSVEKTALSADAFARASLTPLQNLNAVARAPLPAPCR